MVTLANIIVGFSFVVLAYYRSAISQKRGQRSKHEQVNESIKRKEKMDSESFLNPSDRYNK